MRPSYAHYLRIVSALGVLAVASPATADDATDAKALFDRGFSDMEASRYDTGCKLLAESHRLDARPGTLFTLATCESRWGHSATAAARFNEYLALYDKFTEEQKKRQSQRAENAREELGKLAAETPVLTLALPPDAPTGTVVKRNGSAVTPVELGTAVALDPGEYLVSTQAPGGPVWEQRVMLGKGEKKRVHLEVKRAPEPQPPLKAVPLPPKIDTGPTVPSALPPAQGTSKQRKAAYAIGSLGLAGLALGGVMGGLTLGKKSIIEKHCGSAIGKKDPTACDQTGLDAANSAPSLGLASTIGFVAGGAALVTGIVLRVTDRAPPTPSSRASGRWVAPEVLSAGPGGAMVGMRGVW